jgi:hypothetical protein
LKNKLRRYKKAILQSSFYFLIDFHKTFVLYLKDSEMKGKERKH